MALTQILTTDSVLASVVNTKIVDPANTAISGLQIAQTAGGTATAITLTGIELTNGYQKTFVINANNNGTATTVNGKPLYKPGGTVAPNLVSGKAASIWYSLAGDCFFYKASAEGTATAGDVLAGKTFSNDDDTGLTGTLALTGNALVSDVVIGKTFYNTDAKNKLTGTYSNIKSIQTGFTAMDTTPKTITISSVDINNTIVIVSETSKIGSSGYTQENTNAVSAKITNSTTLTLTNGQADSIISVFWQVIEFNNVKSLQTGTFTFSSSSEQSITIAAVNLNKAMLITSYKSNNSQAQRLPRMRIINSTTLGALQSYYGTYIWDVNWQVIEFN